MITAFIAKIPPAWRWAIMLWLAARLVLILLPIGLWSAGLTMDYKLPSEMYYGIPPVVGGLSEPLMGIWQRWDALHYQRIVLTGYTAPDVTAFFPLYPLLGWLIFSLTSMDTLAALLLVSSLAALLLLVELYELMVEDYGTQVARAATAAAVLLPTSFYLFAPYPTSLSLLLILLAYRSVRRKQYFFASLAGIAAGLAHGTGVPLVLLLGCVVIRTLREPGKKIIDWLSLIVPLTPLMGTALFMAWREAQGFPAYAYLLDSVWSRAFQWPWVSLMRLPNTFADPVFVWSVWSDLLFLIISVAALVWGWKHLKRDQWVYCLATIFFILSTPLRNTPLVGYGRYVLMMFPLFAVIGMWVQNQKVRKLAIAPALLAQFVLVTFYFFWIWVD